MTLAEYLSRKKIKPAEFAPRVGLSAEGLRLILKGQRKAGHKTARKIEDVTGGDVPKEIIRPDLWSDPPQRGRAA